MATDNEKKPSILTEFRDFIMRGNVVDLAVAVVIGAAFGVVISSLVKDIITPIIAAIFGKPNFGNLSFTIHHSEFFYGDFINAVITFLTVAAAIRPMQIRIITAGKTDTVASLAQRMAFSDYREERFRALNGLQPGDTITLGQRVKIVIE